MPSSRKSPMPSSRKASRLSDTLLDTLVRTASPQRGAGSKKTKIQGSFWTTAIWTTGDGVVPWILVSLEAPLAAALITALKFDVIWGGQASGRLISKVSDSDV